VVCGLPLQGDRGGPPAREGLVPPSPMQHRISQSDLLHRSSFCARGARMAQNFIPCDRWQAMLLPPSLTDWLPEDHLVWTVLGAVEQMDLDEFYGGYRANGQGRAAYDPAMMA
jgi:hypothetical protein